jgi:hypothetical protein
MNKSGYIVITFFLFMIGNAAQQPIMKKLIFVDQNNNEFEIELDQAQLETLATPEKEHSYLFGALASLSSENEYHIYLPGEFSLSADRINIISTLMAIAQLPYTDISSDATARLQKLAELKKNSIPALAYDLEELIYLADFLGYEQIGRFYTDINRSLQEYESFLIYLKNFPDNEAKQYAVEMFLLKQVNPITSLGTVRYLYTLASRYLLFAEIFSQIDIQDLLTKSLANSQSPSLMMISFVLKFVNNGTLKGMEDDLKTLFMKLVQFVNNSYATEFQGEEYDDLTSIFYRLLMSLGLSSADQDIYWSVSDTIEV